MKKFLGREIDYNTITYKYPDEDITLTFEDKMKFDEIATRMTWNIVGKENWNGGISIFAYFCAKEEILNRAKDRLNKK